jgi:small-conductance mechanosensitive channel
MNQYLQALGRTGWEHWSAPVLSGLRILLIVAAAWIAILVLQRLIGAVRLRVEARLDAADGPQRAETLGRVVRYLIALTVSVVASMLVLAELGISLAPILGAAGVVGLAVGFGAQSLVKDYFTGFFILFEDQIRTGDFVTIADRSGIVEDITLRHVRLRDYEGNVHFVPNSLVTTVTNMSRSFAQAVVEVGVSSRENIDQVMSLMEDVATMLQTDPAYAARILANLEMAGVERFENGAVVLRCRFKVMPLQQWSVRREYLRRLKIAFDHSGIELHLPRMALYGPPVSNSAPAT